MSHCDTRTQPHDGTQFTASAMHVPASVGAVAAEEEDQTRGVGSTPRVRSTSPALTAWIFDDKEAEKQGIASQLGCHVQRVFETFRMTSQSVLDETCSLMQQLRPKVIWCSLFRSGTPRGNRRDRQAMRALRRILLLACTLSCLVVVESSATNPAWQMEEMVELVQSSQWNNVWQKWCCMDVRHPNTGKYSSRLSRVLTTSSAMQDASVCSCDRKTGRLNDANEDSRTRTS